MTFCAKKRRYRALQRAMSSDGQTASGRLYTDTGTSGKIGRYEVAGVRFEACKLKSRREKLPSSSASWILERSSRLRATSDFGPTADWIYGPRSRLRSGRPIWWYTMRETGEDVKIRNNGLADRTTRRISARSRSINWEFHCRPRFIFVPSREDRTTYWREHNN